MNQDINSRSMRGLQSVRAENTGVNPEEIKGAIENLNNAFEEFKIENNKQIDDLKSGRNDVIQAEKVERINADIGKLYKAVDEINIKQALASAPKGDTLNDPPEMREFKANFDKWARTGTGEEQVKAAYRSGGVMAAMTVGSNPDGGLTAPVEWDRQITDKLATISQMRRYASVQNVKGQGFKHLYNVHGAGSGWVGETDARPGTDTPKFAEYEFKFGEIYAQPGISQSLLEDSELNIANYLASEVDLEFAQQEGTAFLSGNGIKKPKGILMYDKASEDALADSDKHPLGHVKESNSGAASAITSDGLIDLVYNIPSERITEASAFYMNRATHATIRKMKDGQGNYLWQPPFQAGQPAQLLGYAVRELSGMPDVAANSIPIMFGDMARSYRIFDRVGVQVLRDPYTNKPYVMFYTRKRVGGGLWNPEFLRYHRVAA